MCSALRKGRIITIAGVVLACIVCAPAGARKTAAAKDPGIVLPAVRPAFQSTIRLKPGQQGHIWSLIVKATGQVIEDHVNKSSVHLGIEEEAVSYSSPGPPPDYTVYMYFSGGLLEDYRGIGTSHQVWTLIIRVEDRADAALVGFFPQLSWDPNDIGTAARMELRLGDPNGDLLVPDMRITGVYQTKESDASYYNPSLDRAVLTYSIVFEPVVFTLYPDDDGDGCGDPNRLVTALEVLPGYVDDPCDCDDADDERFVGNPEVCDGKDNDCNGFMPVDEQTDEDQDGILACNDCDDADKEIGACIAYYRDQDGDGYGVTGDNLCLCGPEGFYTAVKKGDPDDGDPNVPGTLVEIEMAVGAGWGMISLPAMPLDETVDELFPDAIAVFRHTAAGYELLDGNEFLLPDKGYWIYLPQAHTYTISGMPIMDYAIPDAQSGWSMIGGCTYPALPSAENGMIRAVFGFTNRYIRVSPGDMLQPGRGYWINCSQQATLSVEVQ